MDLQDEGTIHVPNLRSDRSGTLKLLSWWKHETVRAATVMIVGLGALGNEVAKNLALLGIGRSLDGSRGTGLVTRESLDRSHSTVIPPISKLAMQSVAAF